MGDIIPIRFGVEDEDPFPSVSSTLSTSSSPSAKEFIQPAIHEAVRLGLVERVEDDSYRLTASGMRAGGIIMALAILDAKKEGVDAGKTTDLHAFVLGMKDFK